MSDMSPAVAFVGLVAILFLVVILFALLALFSWWVAGSLLAHYAFERLTITLLVAILVLVFVGGGSSD